VHPRRRPPGTRSAPTRPRTGRTVLAVGLLVGLAPTSCGGDDRAAGPSTTSTSAATAGTAPVVAVPGDVPTIAAALERVAEGGLVLISPGTYRESVTVETRGVTIRGLDRDAVVLDGGDQMENGFLVVSDGVVIENLTIHSYRSNGVVVTGDYGKGRALDGYRLSHVTAYNNGLYGLYGFNAVHGQIDHTYTSGHPDAGIYVGQCYPCDTLVIDDVAEHNAVGFQNTNAGGNLVVARSVWSHNRVGVEPNSSTKETTYPQRESTIVANRITDNNDASAPKATEAFGVGIAIGAGHGNIVRRNVVTGNAVAGVAMAPQEQFIPEDNVVSDNDLSGNGVDLAYLAADGAAHGNCFSANRFATSTPADIERVLSCMPEALGGSGRLDQPAAPPDVDHRTVAAPGPQPGMADPAGSPHGPATNLPPTIDVDALVVPS